MTANVAYHGNANSTDPSELAECDRIRDAWLAAVGRSGLSCTKVLRDDLGLPIKTKTPKWASEGNIPWQYRQRLIDWTAAHQTGEPARASDRARKSKLAGAA